MGPLMKGSWAVDGVHYRYGGSVWGHPLGNVHVGAERGRCECYASATNKDSLSLFLYLFLCLPIHLSQRSHTPFDFFF